MKLHQDIKLFSDTLRAASQYLDIKLEFVEKDYWITLVLSRLAKSKYVDESVFKGGILTGHLNTEPPLMRFLDSSFIRRRVEASPRSVVLY